jgi:DNA repair protein RecN (Recombination protein N)
LRHIGKPELILQCDQIIELSHDLSFALNREIAAVADQAARFEVATERMMSYREAFRKFQVPDVEGLVAISADLQKKAAQLDQGPELLKQHITAWCADAEQLQTLSETWDADLRKAAKIFEEKSKKEFSSLSLPHASLEIAFTPRKIEASDETLSTWVSEHLPQQHERFRQLKQFFEQQSSYGGQDIRFNLRTNPGEPMRPMHLIASGGEMSRIMLAIKHCLGRIQDVPTLVFDEIDTGISGQVADKVGKKMSSLAKVCQVIAISHLPQVAAYADHHLFVEKNLNSTGSMQTSISPLDESQREKELARLVSAQAVTQQSLANAKDLLRLARNQPTSGL